MQHPDHEDFSDLPQVREVLDRLHSQSRASQDWALARAMDRLPSADRVVSRSRRWGVAKQVAAWAACAAGIGIIVSAVFQGGAPFASDVSRQSLLQPVATLTTAAPGAVRIGSESYPTLEAAIAAADPNDTVLLSQARISVGLRISKPMLLVNSGNNAAGS